MKRMISCLGVALLALTGSSSGQQTTGEAPLPNELTEAEKAAGWKLLFDGHSTAGWRGFGRNEFPKRGWMVEDGCLKHTRRGGGGDLLTVEQFGDFDFEFEWRMADGGNSGVKYFVKEKRGPIGHEYQLLGNFRDGGLIPSNKWQTASFYDVLAVGPGARLRPLGEFNHSRILVQGNHVEHWLNDQKVVEYELGSDAVKAAVAQSKFRELSDFGTKFRTPLLLQDHGGEIWFRNLKIRELPSR